jgi:hypothetical protein
MRGVHVELGRLPRLDPSRRVSCTNPCTNPVPDLPVSGLLARVRIGLVENASTASATNAPVASRPDPQDAQRPRTRRGSNGYDGNR